MNATNLQSAVTLSGPWTLLGATNWSATNPPALRYFRALGVQIQPRRGQDQPDPVLTPYQNP